MKFKAVFFDFDGTLMDTSEGIVSSGKKSMVSCGLDPVFKSDPSTFIGPPLDDCFRLTFGVTDKKMLTKLCTEYRKFYHSEGRFMACFYPGIVETIKEIKRRGYLLGVATLKYVELAQEMLEYFKVADLFDTVTGLNKDNSSTKASLLIDGAKNLGIEPKDLVLVGDSFYDLNGAKEAETGFIGVSWGFGFPKDMEGLVDRPQQILDLI